MRKCIGIWGRLFGHKFIKKTLDYEYRSDTCWRCGFTPDRDDQ